jgi:ATP-dependent RNA helicase DDX54/DBP10
LENPKSPIRHHQPFKTSRIGDGIAMPHRAVSPAVSENEFDITNSLFKGNVTTDDDDFPATSIHRETLDAGEILDLGLDSIGDDDEAFIAAQQAASNRKASNIKGKSVKKGGGFQAMGAQFKYHR